MTWETPWALALLLPVWALVAQPWLTGINRLAVPGLVWGERRLSLRLLLAWVPRALTLVGLSLAVLALARPCYTHSDTVVESQGLDILLLLDTSGSMEQEDFSDGMRSASRLEAAKAVVGGFVDGRPHDRIGLVLFGEEAFTFVPLTLDHETLGTGLRSVQLGMAGGRATAIGTAIAVGSRRMEELDAPSKVMILLTDGQSNAGRFTPAEAAKMAAALDIRLYTVGVGSAQTRRGLFGWGGGDNGLDEASLQEVATLTGGRYFRATDTRTLEAIYDSIDQLEPSPAKVREVVEHEERYRDYLTPALALLVLQALLSATWLRRGP
ncbi:MAG: VWA domain-containing protein [Deltaproteobacteria bacterium]|nr:VWA domain-containing protein [Deltaproteobacteria bacterium]